MLNGGPNEFEMLEAVKHLFTESGNVNHILLLNTSIWKARECLISHHFSYLHCLSMQFLFSSFSFLLSYKIVHIFYLKCFRSHLLFSENGGEKLLIWS